MTTWLSQPARCESRWLAIHLNAPVWKRKCWCESFASLAADQVKAKRIKLSQHWVGCYDAEPAALRWSTGSERLLNMVLQQQQQQQREQLIPMFKERNVLCSPAGIRLRSILHPHVIQQVLIQLCWIKRVCSIDHHHVQTTWCPDNHTTTDWVSFFARLWSFWFTCDSS